MSGSKRKDPWFILRATLALSLFFGGGGFVINELVSNKSKANAFKADIKQRCAPVYRTLENGNVTSIYRCPDDTRYEFTERL